MGKIDLENIVSPGSIIRTKHPKSEWISNVVYKVNGNLIQVELTQDYINNLILVGDEVKCKFFSPEAELLLDGTVDNIDIDISKLLTISVSKVNIFKNIRSNHRYDTYMISRLSINRDTQVFCIANSLSSSGLSLISKVDIPHIPEAYVEVFVDSGNILRFTGEVVRKSTAENGFEIGVRFLELDKENKKILDEILKQLKEKDDSLIKKYLDSISS